MKYYVVGCMPKNIIYKICFEYFSECCKIYSNVLKTLKKYFSTRKMKNYVTTTLPNA